MESPSRAAVLISAVCFLSSKRISLTRTDVWFFATNPLWLPLLHHFVSVPTPTPFPPLPFSSSNLYLWSIHLVSQNYFFYPCLFFALSLKSSKWKSTLFMTSLSFLNHILLCYRFFVYCFLQEASRQGKPGFKQNLWDVKCRDYTSSLDVHIHIWLKYRVHIRCSQAVKVVFQ